MYGTWFAIISLANVKSVIAILYVLIVLATVVVIVNDRRDPVKALSWILVVTMLPVAGLIFYVVFGRNYRKEKIFNRKEIDDFKQIDRLCRCSCAIWSIPRSSTSSPSRPTRISSPCC